MSFISITRHFLIRNPPSEFILSNLIIHSSTVYENPPVLGENSHHRERTISLRLTSLKITGCRQSYVTAGYQSPTLHNYSSKRRGQNEAKRCKRTLSGDSFITISMEDELDGRRMVINSHRHATLPVRTHSQPHYRQPSPSPHLSKVRINHKRLPRGFFRGPVSLDEIPSPRPLPLFNAPQLPIDLADFNRTSYFGGHLQQAPLPSKEPREYKSEQRGRPSRERVGESSWENDQSLMQLTFSKQLGDPKLKMRTERSATDDSKEQIWDVEQCGESKEARRQREEEGRARGLLRQKLGEVQLQRLRINVRKNMHPLPTLKQMKKYVC